MHPLTKSLHRAKLRLAGRETAPGPCTHSWDLLLVEDTWSGPMRLSRCSLCHAVLHEWVSSAEASQN